MTGRGDAQLRSIAELPEVPLSSVSSAGFDLRGFRGTGYDKGRGRHVQIIWMALRPVIAQWWVPNKIRIAALRAFGATIGSGVLIRHDVRIHWPWKLEIGDGTWVGERAWILNLEPVRIGSGVCISQEVMLCTGSHDRRSPTFEFDNAPIVIGNGAWIALRATVLRGVAVGDGAVVGASALVTRDVAERAVVLAPRGEERM